MMDRYDPNQAPDPDEWNALDESEQIQLVKQYHKRERVKSPNTEVHAVFHVVVENQIAMGEEMNVSKTLDRLLSDGLDRHDALHAIGTVIAGHMQSMMSDGPSEFRQDVYASDLDMLTVETWRAMGEPEG
jgi:hypothetical protein